MAQVLAGLLAPASGGSAAHPPQQAQRGRGPQAMPRPQEAGADYDPYGGLFWLQCADLTFN